MGAELARDGGLTADRYFPDVPDQTVGAGLPAMEASKPTSIPLMNPDQTVGAGLPAMAPLQPTHISLIHPDQTVGASLLAIAV